MKSVACLLAAPAGALSCHQTNKALSVVFDKEEFFGHVLQSPVNWFSFAAFYVVCVIMLIRYGRLLIESRWSRLGVLPEAKQFRSYAEVEPFAKLESAQGPRRRFRPLCLLRTCFDSVRAHWSSDSAHQALKTQYELMRDALEAHYYVCTFLVGAIVSIGFVGTLLGLGEAMGVIDQGTGAAVAKLHVAFDTSLVAAVLTMIASFGLTSLKKYDKLVLLSAYDKVLHEFVFRIHDAEDTKQ